MLQGPRLVHHLLLARSSSAPRRGQTCSGPLLSLCSTDPSGGDPLMSKRDKAGKKGKHGKITPCAAEAPAASVPPVPVTRDRTGAVAVSVHAKPGAKHNAVTDVSEDAVGVAIAAAPTDGEANAELLRYLAQVLQLKKSQVALDKGSRSRNKIVTVGTTLSPEEVLDRLRQAAS